MFIKISICKKPVALIQSENFKETLYKLIVSSDKLSFEVSLKLYN